MGRDTDLNADGTKPSERRSPRARTLLIAECRTGNGTVHKIRVRDLSATGLRGEPDGARDLRAGDGLDLRFPNLPPIRGVIARFETGQLGVTFDDPIDPDEVIRARKVVPLPGQSPVSESVNGWIDRGARARAPIVKPRAV